MTLASTKMNPFPGLRPFTQQEDYLFFGREEQTLELLQRLGINRFVAVVGTSGSGKSSLVRCGLMSELLGGRMLEAGAAWEIAVTDPGGNPLALLTDALLEADLYDREEEHARENLLATLSRSHFGLVEAVKQADLGERTNFLLVVDQFEEIFRFHEAGQRQQEAANEFVSLLLEATAQKEVPIYVVLTMRSDFIGECGQFEGLAEMVNRGEFLIPRLTREQYKRVIEGPIKVAGGQIAPRLLQRLLNDLGQQADQLPCLQHALMRTWDVWAGKGDTEALDLDDYQRVGKMSQALSLHADEIYESLADDRRRELCQGLFQALTVEESNSRGIRRPQRLGHLCQILEVAVDELLPIIDAYRQSGVTFLMPSPEVELTDQTIIDISHESLMRVWTRLRQWVEEETQAAGIYHRLSESAALHERGKAGLYRDPELGIALAWRESKRPNVAWAERYRLGFDTAMGFLEASQQESLAEEQAREVARQRELEQARRLAEVQQLRLEQQQRASRKLRKLVAGVAVVAVIAVIACFAALVARNEAGKLAHIADAEAENARSNAKRAAESQQETEKALTQVASQKAEVESSLTKAEKAEQVARTAEEAGRKLLYTTDLELAPFVWRDDRSTAEQLRLLLAKHIPDGHATGNHIAVEKPDLRGFEWHYYQHLLENSAAVFSGHAGSIAGCAFTPNDQLATLDQNGQLRRWNLGSQDEDKASRRDLAGGPNAQARALSPDGRLAALGVANKLHGFDASTGKETFQVDSADVPTRRLIFTPAGDRLVIVDDKIRWCNAVNGELIASLDQKFDRVQSLALAADGLTLAVVGHGPRGDLFSIFRLDATAKTVTPLARDVRYGGTLNASALSPDGKRIAVGASLAGALFLADTATGRLITYHGSAHASPVAAIAFSGDGAKLATADTEGTIKIWADAQKLNSKSTALLTLKGHQGAIHTVGFSSDGKRLASGSEDKTARVWDLDNPGAAIRSLERFANGPSVMARFSPDGQLIADANLGTGSVRLWDASTGKLVRELSAGEKGRVFSVAFSPTDNRLLAVGYGGEADVSYVALWDIDAPTELARLPGVTDLPDFPKDENNSAVGALAFSPDGKYLVAGFGTRNTLHSEGYPTPLKVWDVATRRLIRRLNGHTGYCVSLDFSRDGTHLASGGHDGTAILWSTATWKATQTLQNPDKDSVFGQSGRKGMVEAVAFSPNGKLLALASRERTVQLWDVAAGKLLATLRGHSSAVQAVAFSPDGRTLASGSGDQTVRLWNVETRRELMQLDPGGVELGQVRTLAFSPDGQHLLAGGDGTAFWSTAPLVWNDPDRAAKKLRLLLNSNADFQSRIRMLSENLRLHAALEKLDSNDVRVAASLAAAQANWHASRKAWPEAALAYDRLTAADPTSPEAWLRTPGLLRLATALLQQDRPRDAAALLKGGAKRRALDGLPAAVENVALGLPFSVVGSDAVVSNLQPESPAAKSGLRQGDIIEKVNDTDLANESNEGLVKLLAGEAGTKVRLTVRRTGGAQPQVLELTRERFLQDSATGELLYPLRAAINERLAREPHHPGLLELRAELAGQWSGTEGQVADYTAAIEALSGQTTEAAAADLERLFGRRGNALVALRRWQPALDDYAKAVTVKTTDEDLLAGQALAQAEVLMRGFTTITWTPLKPAEMKSKGGATLTLQDDGSILAGGINPRNDIYTISAPARLSKIAAVLLEAIPDPSLPGGGVGRGLGGSVSLSNVSLALVTAPDATPIPIPFGEAFSDIGLAINAANAIDDRQDTSWVAYPDYHLPHQLVLKLREPIALPEGAQLVIGLEFLDKTYSTHGLGRFRLSVSDDASAWGRARRLGRLTANFPRDPWTKLAAAYQFQGDQQAIDQLIERRPKLAAQIGDLFIQDEDKDWSRAVEIYSRGITAETTDVDLLAKRARGFEALKNWDAAAADWSRAATGNPDGAKLLAEFAQRLAAGGQVPLATAQFEKTQALYERSLKADPENDVVAAELAQLLLNQSEYRNPARWTVLRPTEMKSEKGATLTLQGDGSILASGTNTEGDIYTITAVGNLDRVVAVRLEAVPDASLPKKGPGRHESGNFHLRAFRLYQSLSDGEKGLRPVPIGHALASYEWKASDEDIAGTIDESLKKFWHVWGRLGEPHQAVFFLREPVSGKDRPFVIELRHGLNLGRFRLSVSGDLAAPEQEDKRLAVLKVTGPWLKLAAAYALNGRHDEASQYFRKALQRADGYEARKPILELAARFDDQLSALAQQQPDDSQLQLAWARKLAERGQQRLAEKQPAEAEAELLKSRAIFTRVRTEPRWTVPTPTELKSNGGETLAVENDGSIFVSGPNPDRAVYTLMLRTSLPTVTAIRLETIPDARLPEGGAGRYGNGNFHLSELTAAIVSGNAGRQSTPIVISSAIVDTQYTENETAKNIIDGNPQTRWDTYPKVLEAHWALFGLKSPVRIDGGSLSITLDSGITSWGKHGLGRFRLSVTNDAEALRREPLRKDLKESEVVDLNVALAKAYAQQGHIKEAVASLTEALDLAADRAGKARIITEAAPFEGVLEKLAESVPKDGQLLAELARHFAGQGDTAHANAALALVTAQFEKAQALYELSLKAHPEDDVVATELAQLLFDKAKTPEPDWVVLKPADTKTESGDQLTVQQDGSILVEPASNAAQETVRWQPGPQPVRALRIETTTHTVPPAKGAFFNEYQIVAASLAAAQSGALRGRYLRLDLPGDSSQFPRYPSDKNLKTINLAELQVFQGDRNIALRKKATQSSGGGESRLAPGGAVDGNTVGNDSGNPYAHTGMEDNPWWEVDLGSEQAIDRIVVWNRTDTNLYIRMNHFRIRVLDQSQKVVFEQVIDKAPSPSTAIVPYTLVAGTKSEPLASNQPFSIRLPRNPLKDAPPRFRVSVATRLADLGAETTHRQAMKVADVTTRLAAAYALNGRHAEASQYFSKALQRADGYEARKPILELAARFDDQLSALVQQQPDDLQLQLAWARKLAERGKKLLAEKQPAEAEAELQKSRAIFTRLPTEPRWTVLTPTQLKSNGGETLAVENDGSIFVSGPTPDRAVYTLTLRTDLPTVTAIRLETIPDARLPKGGAGRSPEFGNFHLSELTAAIVSGKADGQSTPIVISSAIADTQQTENETAKNIIDGNPQTRWDTYPKVLEAHWAVFGLKSPVRIDGGFLSITLDTGITMSQHGLGRFRLSVTNDAEALMGTQLRKDLKDSEVADLNADLAQLLLLAGDTQRAADLLVESGGGAWIASWLESGVSIDGVLDSMQARHPEKCARLLQDSAGAAAERGKFDQARTLYARLIKFQPKNGLWKERTEQFRPGVLTVWNFDNGVGPWGNANDCVLSVKDGVLTARTTGGDPNFSTPVSAPAGGKAIVLRYRTDRAFTMQLFWSDTSGGPDEPHHGDYPLPAAAGAWREVVVPFSTQGTMNLLRLDPNTAPDHPLEVDSILLRELEPGDIGSLPADNALLTRLAAASQAAGRTREALLFFARASADNPKDTWLSLKVAALQAWFGQEKELAATRQRILAFAKGTGEAVTAERAAKACSILPSTDKAELEAALALARSAVKLGNGVERWNLLALGMSEYRSGNDADAEKALLAAAEESLKSPDDAPLVTGVSSFFRAMSLFRVGKKDEARELAIAAAAKMKPLPTDEGNPLAVGQSENDLIVWLAYKEAKRMIHFETAPPPKAENNTK